VLHGAIGLAKAAAQALGVPVDLVDEQTINARAEACRCCPHHARGQKLAGQPCKPLAINSVCTACSCLLIAKVRLASEKCPLDPPKWEAVERAMKDDSSAPDAPSAAASSSPRRR
jgi:hypothetical protein